MRAILSLAAALALAGCSYVQNPTDTPVWPVSVVPAAAQPGQVVAVPPECGSVPPTARRMDATAWHDPNLGLGCSTARNLALQVQEPRDLLSGRPLGTPDAERETLAMQRYRKGEEKDLMRAGTQVIFGADDGGR